MAKIEDLINSIPDLHLQADIAREVSELKSEKKYGLVFEEHISEQIQMPSLLIKPGLRVIRRGISNEEVFKVQAQVDDSSFLLFNENTNQELVVSAKDLVVVKKFGEPIYPSLKLIDQVTTNPSKPYHTIINAENYHALQLFEYTHTGLIDLIYIDPPYNTQDKDWKYNNDYVDKVDSYRHSKWLAMMKKRLKLAKKLLTIDGILICAIDENEHARLILLLEDLYPEYDITSIAIVHNPRGTQGDNFSNTNDFAVYVVPKGCKAINDRILEDEDQSISNLRNWGGESKRTDAKNCFYPIYVKDNVVIGFGDVAPDDYHPENPVVELEDGVIAIWPIDDKKVERKWRYARQSVESIKDLLLVKKGRKNLQIKLQKNTGKYKTVWSGTQFDASTYGTQLVNNILKDEFPYPKSLYTMLEVLESVTRNKKDALILDYFAGSGTTLHATVLLNSIYPGNRRCILVTNNEVKYEVERELTQNGIWPGNSDFDKFGICNSVTWPRCKYIVTGKRNDGTELEGTYLNGRELKQGFNENLNYFNLQFLDPDEVAYGDEFSAIVPILWLMAGALGALTTNLDNPKWLLPDQSNYAVLIDETAFAEFKRIIKDKINITHIFLVTDSERAYREMIAELPNGIHTRMLYKSYLDNFRINLEKSL